MPRYSYNPARAFAELTPKPPLRAGEVTAVDGGQATVTLPDGATLTALGSATIGQRVYVRDGRIEGEAPALPVVVIEV